MIDPTTLDYEDIERELRAFEADERKRLGIEEEASEHWHDANPQAFTRDERETTSSPHPRNDSSPGLMLSGACMGSKPSARSKR